MIATAGNHLKDGGSLLMEFGDSSNEILEMASFCFGSSNCKLIPDYTGRPRVLKVTT
jgi:hypothetical protein